MMGEEENRYLNNALINMAPCVGMATPIQADSQEFERFGILYKHCEKKYLPKKGSFIKLGTLSGYRASENAFVQDKEEGIFHVRLEFEKPTNVTKDWINRVSLGTCPIGSGKHKDNIIVEPFFGNFTQGMVFSTDDLSIEIVEGGSMAVRGSLDIEFEGADAFVLCLSRESGIGSVIDDPLYDSIWKVKQGAVREFARRLSSLLMAEIQKGLSFNSQTVGPFEFPGFPSPPSLGRGMSLGICSEIWEVEYKQKTIIVNEASEYVVSEVRSSLDLSARIKPPEFLSEREVRLLFRPVVVDRVNNCQYFFPNYLNHAMIPVDDVLDLIEVNYSAK